MMNKFKNGLGHSLVLAGMCLAMLLFMSHKSVAQEVGEVGYMYTPDAQTTFRYVITTAADGEGNGGEVAVRKYNDNVSGAIEIPSSVTITVNEANITYAVTAVRADGFRNCASLTSVTFPSSVTSIGQNAFNNCSALASVSLVGSGVTSIGQNAFGGCSALTSVTLNDALSTIGRRAFRSSGLTSVTIPSSVTSIGNGAFSNCESLTSVTIQDGITSIGDSVFELSNLASVTLPSSVTTIGNYAFANCLNSQGTLDLSNVTSIGVGAFQTANSGGITSVVFNSSLTTIPENAFRNRGLTTVTLPSSVTTIGNYAFANCPFSSQGTLDLSNVTSIGDYAFVTDDVIGGITSVTFSSSLTTIGDNAFRHRTGLTSVTIPASVTSIGAGAFYGCYNLSNIRFTRTASTPTIGANAFNELVYHGTVFQVPAGMLAAYKTAIGWTSDDLYYHAPMSSLYYIVEGDGVVVVTVDGIRYIVLDAVNRKAQVLSWNGVSGSKTIASAVSGFGSGDETSQEYEVTTIMAEAFNGSDLTSITLPSSVTSIGSNAFASTGALTSVTFEGTGLTTIGSNAFYNSGLTSITLPSSVTTIGNNAFENCLNSQGALDLSNVTSIGDRAFQSSGSNGITSVVFSSSLTTIPENAFRNRGLTSVNIPASVTSIGAGAFYGCVNMTDVTFNRTESAPAIGSVLTFSHLKAHTTTFHVPTGMLDAYKTAIGWNSNDGHHNAPMSELYYIVEGDGVAVVTVDGIRYTVLDAVNRKAQVDYNRDVSGSKTIASSVSGFGSGDETSQSYEVTTIIANAFRNSGLTSITLPSSMTTIGDDAFTNAYQLTSVTIPSSVTTIGNSAFAGSGLTSITLPNSVTTIGNYAFENCLNSQGALDLSNVTSIGQGAFQGSGSGISSVTLSSSLTTIPANAFRSRGLTTVTIPASVTSIGDNAFKGNTVLVDITFQGTTPPTIPLIENNFIDNTPALQYIYVPCANLATYKAAYTTDYIPSSRRDKISPIRSGEAIASTLTSDLNLTGEDCDCKAIPSTLTIRDKASLSFEDYTNFVAAMKDVTINVEKELDVDEWNLISALNGTRIGETYAFLDNNLGQTDGLAHAMAAVPYDFENDGWDAGYVSRADNTPIASQSFMVYPVNVALTTDGNTGTVDEELSETKITLTQTISGNEVNEKNNVYIPLTSTNSEKWYPLANPYLGRLNLNKFHEANESNLQDNYAWIFKDGDWEGVDISGATNYAIYPASGFLVSLPEISSETTLNMHVNQIVTDESVTMKSAEGNNKITLSATNNGVEKEIYAHIDDVSDNGYGRLDAKVMFSSNEDAVNPYFNVEGRNIFDNYFSVLPAEYELNFNSYKSNQIDFALKEEISEIEVTLIDIANNNAETVLNVNDPVQINLTEGQNEGRYRLRFAPKNSNINDVVSSENNINIWNRLSEINISGKDLKRVEIFNTLGQKVYHAQLSGDSATFNSNLSDGAYIVKVYTQSSIKSKKVIIR